MLKKVLTLAIFLMSFNALSSPNEMQQGVNVENGGKMPSPPDCVDGKMPPPPKGEEGKMPPPPKCGDAPRPAPKAEEGESSNKPPLPALPKSE